MLFIEAGPFVELLCVDFDVWTHINPFSEHLGEVHASMPQYTAMPAYRNICSEDYHLQGQAGDHIKL